MLSQVTLSQVLQEKAQGRSAGQQQRFGEDVGMLSETPLREMTRLRFALVTTLSIRRSRPTGLSRLGGKEEVKIRGIRGLGETVHTTECTPAGQL